MGSIAFGKYRLIAEIGHGGMADVFLAVQAGPIGSGFSKLTVIKRLRQNLVEEPEFVAMLVDEARIAARLNHPNVVQTNEVGNVGKDYFIAMEYLDGQPLHRIQHRVMRAKEGEPRTVTPELQYLIVMDSLAGLHHAHELADYDGTPLEIVHRDVTPQNIFVTYEGQVKVMDFGIAKAAGRASETRQGVIKGKVRYMAPEQALGLNVTRRADIFSVGILLWEAAMGRRMWTGKDDTEVVRALLAGEFPPMPRELNPDVAEPIDKICRKALSFHADDRYQTAEEFRLELEEYLAESGLLLPKRRELGPVVAELFKDKRDDIRGIIEEQLARVDNATSSSSSRLMSIPQDGLSRTSLSVPSRTDTGPSPAVSSVAEDNPFKSNRRPLVFFATVALFAVALAAFWRAHWQAGDRGAPKVAVEEISLRVRSNPASARVSIDDAPFQSLPLDIKVHRDDRRHRVRIEAEGFEPRTEEVSFASDVTMQLDLVHVRPISPTPTSASTRQPAAKALPPPAPAPAPWRPPPARPADRPEAKVEPPPPPPAPPPSAPDPAPPPKRGGISLDKTDPWGQR